MTSYNEAMFDEERSLKQKSKVQWLKEGDGKSGYFSRVVKLKARRSRIHVVELMPTKEEHIKLMLECAPYIVNIYAAKKYEHGETEDTFHHMIQCSNAMEDDEVDAAMHMELNNPTDYNLDLSSEEKEVQEEEIPNKFAQRGRSRGSHPKSSTSRSIPTRRGSSSIVGRGREIANEWSPRGRGNNSSSGNDDCSPRGRGINNTSGNGRGIADDISPRGRKSNNRDISYDCSQIGRASSNIGRRGNESVDEWCPGLNILGDEILDVHEDNKEHVVHVVGSSQNQVGSNVTPSSSLPKLWLVGEVFYDPAISRHAVRLFKTMLKGAYATWTKVPQDHHDKCFKRFKNRYSDIMRVVRKDAMKVTRVNDNVDIGRISSNYPIWIGVADWQPMINVWDTDEDSNQKLPKRTEPNRNPESTQQAHVAFSTLRSQWLIIHILTVSDNLFIPYVIPKQDEYSKIISEKNKENERYTKIDENGSKSPPDDFELSKDVGTSNRGHVLGAGFMTDPAFVLTGTMRSASIYATHTCSPYEEIRILKKQNDDLKKKMKDAEVQRVADQLALHKTLKDFAKNYPPRATELDPGAS
uniref:RNA-directed DNA polymerase, eukaryota, reverse transcriptase zinc-binding domain protein n=1 Tax=Tanacetum cinerariifolium TaxID=118510 RepID=A0A699HJ87_TANCI|nr:RNA-directed DNA polymerase, eukaryota, reverse transcriptase zinc-binding domain protein [Tanacetum cinerariifolium]